MNTHYSKCLHEIGNTITGFKGERITGITRTKLRCDALWQLQMYQTTGVWTESERKERRRPIREWVELHDWYPFWFQARKTCNGCCVHTETSAEEALEGNNKRYWTFVDMEKAFDRVPREVVYWRLRGKGVTQKMVRFVKSMYEDFGVYSFYT